MTDLNRGSYESIITVLCYIVTSIAESDGLNYWASELPLSSVLLNLFNSSFHCPGTECILSGCTSSPSWIQVTAGCDRNPCQAKTLAAALTGHCWDGRWLLMWHHCFPVGCIGVLQWEKVRNKEIVFERVSLCVLAWEHTYNLQFSAFFSIR